MSQNIKITVVTKQGGNAAQWITAACSVATLAIVGATANELVNKSEKVREVTKAVKHPVATFRQKFARKDK